MDERKAVCLIWAFYLNFANHTEIFFEQQVKLGSNETTAPLLTLAKAYPMQGVLCTEEGTGFLFPGQVGFGEYIAFLSG